jgi:hypothetical protein
VGQQTGAVIAEWSGFDFDIGKDTAAFEFRERQFGVMVTAVDPDHPRQHGCFFTFFPDKPCHVRKMAWPDDIGLDLSQARRIELS